MKSERRIQLLALGLAAAFGLGACGGGDEEGSSAASSKPGEAVRDGGKEGDSAAKRSGEGSAKDAPGGARRGGAAAERRSGGKDSKGKAAERRRRLTRAEALRRLPRKFRARYVKRFAKIIVAATDLDGGKVAVSYGGVAVRVTLPRRVACRAVPNEGARILRELKKIAPYPRSVTVSVAGSSQALPAYLASNCKRRALPGGRGRTVLQLSGSSVRQSKPFKIRSKSWTIEYVSKGTFFSVFVFKGKKAQPNPISEQAPRSGKQTYKGPGTFKLNIAGSRSWTIRVRDGA